MKLRLKRPHQIMDMGRPYTIWTEQGQLASISAGEQIEVEVPADAAELFATSVWYSSNRLNLSDQADFAELEVRNSCSAWMLLIPLLPLYYMMVKNRYLRIAVRG